jgi:hypothetical protein
MRKRNQLILIAALATMIAGVFVLSLTITDIIHNTNQAEKCDTEPHTMYAMPEIIPSVWVLKP